MKTKQYKVGDHVFEIQFVDDNNDESLLPSFRPFELKDSDDVPLFRVIVDDSFKFDELGHYIGQFDCCGSNHRVQCDDDGLRVCYCRKDDTADACLCHSL